MSEITPNTPNPVREDAYVEELSEKLGIDPQYIPKSPVWRNEEEIKAIAEMFANMSGGSSGGVLVVHVDEDTGALDKTWQEIHDASFAVIKTTDSNGSYASFIVGAGKVKDLQTGDYVYNVQFTDIEQSFIAKTDSPSGYPVFVDE